MWAQPRDSYSPSRILRAERPMQYHPRLCPPPSLCSRTSPLPVGNYHLLWKGVRLWLQSAWLVCRSGKWPGALEALGSVSLAF